MNASLLFRISLRSLQKHKGRSFLTILGIIIGISAIIATLAIGRGAEEKTRKQYLAMGDNYIVLFGGNWFQEGKTSTKKQTGGTTWMQERDVPIVNRLVPEIKYISPMIGTRKIVSYRENSILVEIKGGNEQFLKILGRTIKRGTFFNKNHVTQGTRVAVIGTKSARELFKTLDPIGKIIRINNIPFSVIGIIKKIENYHGIHDPNFDILIPLRALKRDIFKTSRQWIHNIVISAPTKDDIPKLVNRLRKVMRFRRKLKDGDPDNFTIIDQASILKAAQKAAATIRLLLLIIASISLLVGGIGIMNIMLVSVTERTREIGIRMALGADSSVILRQFIVEAITLCLIGGIIGALLGTTIPYAIAHFTKWSPIVTTSSILVAFLTTTAIGIFFGFYPAYKAAHLNPVDALAEQ